MGDGRYLPTHPESVQRGQDTYLLSNPQYQRYDFVSEGDSPAFFYLLDRGLRGMEDPSYGSWAGRFGSGGRTADASRDVYRNTAYDYNPNKANNQRETQYCLTRWINDIQSEFGARADWRYTPYYRRGNGQYGEHELKYYQRVIVTVVEKAIGKIEVFAPEGTKDNTIWSGGDDGNRTVSVFILNAVEIIMNLLYTFIEEPETFMDILSGLGQEQIK